MRSRPRQSRKCTLCGQRMRKNGHDRYGRQRWECTGCMMTSGARNPQKRQRAQLDEFLEWLLSASPQGRTARAFRKRTAWCWDLAPAIEPDGVVHHTVMVDGTYFPKRKWCLLVTMDGNTGEVLGWQWCDKETTAAYRTLMARIAPPDVLICDGFKGIPAACKETWPGTRIQRCLVHVQRDTRTNLTSRPKLPAGKTLKKISDALSLVKDPGKAAEWAATLATWHTSNQQLIKERTYAKDDPDNPKAGTQEWWYTHLKLRQAYKRLETLYQDGTLFTYLDQTLLADGDIPRNSNRIEGFNAHLKRMADNHRGMPDQHFRRACEWRCYMASKNPDPYQFITHATRHIQDETENEDDIEMPGYGTGIEYTDLHTSTPYQAYRQESVDLDST